eukprot:TRINITY_DN6241_c0_g1_i2.p1 TRINITY_DN6241_c0_g1~~TRINITY_DN6241_c0_g1_i2.p1  ORF type:complete len:144 (+),score=10.46 TRINITY_DN6241_c0_g1_i2:47-478(+)
MVVKSQGRALMRVPRESITKEMCEVAVCQDRINLQFVPEDLKTEKICLIAVKKDGIALEFVKMELITEEMCRAAVENTWNAICYVPLELMTNEVGLIAVQKERREAIRYIPYEKRTPEMLKLAGLATYEPETTSPNKKSCIVC